jgi:ABC-type phosphate transport system permease subunit
VFLLLSAQYESFLIPFSVILSLPTGICGAFFLLLILGLENNIYAQISMIMLIGLLGKNAILIVEFAILKQKSGMSIVAAAVEGAKARLRPILMTSFAFIAGLVLAIMIIPIVTSVAREVFAQTPLERIQAAYALGATKWSMIKAVVFPYGRGGVIGGAMLGLGRALGETVAVYTVLNLVYDIRIEILLSAGGSVASMIVNKFGEADQVELQALMAAGFVLFLVTLAVNFLANFIINKTARE